MARTHTKSAKPATQFTVTKYSGDLSKKSEAAHVKNPGNCPFCAAPVGPDDAEENLPLQYGDGVYWQDIECRSCHRCWTETFFLTTVEATAQECDRCVEPFNKGDEVTVYGDALVHLSCAEAAEHLIHSRATMPDNLPLHAFPFSTRQWEEIMALVEGLDFGFEPMTCKLPRYKWVAIAHLAMGKGQRVREGYYDMEHDTKSDDAWAKILWGIASMIFEKFMPGDGVL